MNIITLKFSDQYYEKQYQNQRNVLNEHKSKEFKILFIFLLTIEIINDVTLDRWTRFILNGTAILLITFTIIKQYNFKRIKEFFTIIAIIIYNIHAPIENYLNIPLSNTGNLQNFFICLGTFGVVSNFPFWQRGLLLFFILVLNFISMILTLCSWKDSLLFILSTIITYYYYYSLEKETRLAFIVMVNKSLIEQNLFQETDAESFIIHYNIQQTSLDLIRQQQIGNIENDQKQKFTTLIRTMRVMFINKRKQLISSIESQEFLNLTNKMSLEQFLFYLFTNQDKLQILNSYDNSGTSLFKLMGLIGLDVYKITIIKCFDIKPCAIIIIKENKKEAQNKSLKYKLKIQQKLLTQIFDTSFSQIRISLVYLKYLKLNSPLSNQEQQKIFSSINSHISKAYNDLLNINDFLKINSNFACVTKTNFDIRATALECIDIVKHLQKMQNIKISCNSHLKHNFVIQDQRKVKQLLLNCFFFICKTSKSIQIEIKEEQSLDLYEKEIKFEIYFQGPIFSIEKMRNLPIINPQSLEELRHNTCKSIDLELPLALMVVRQIGPYSEIQFRQNSINKMNFLTFSIFKNLGRYQLIPIFSLRPSNYIITNKNCFKQNYDGYLTSEPQLETFRKINQQMVSKC